MKNRPVVVGVSSIQQKGTFDELDEPLILMDSAAKAAIRDTGNSLITDFIDEIRIPKGFWKYRDPGKWIAKNNNFKNVPTTYVTKIGILQQNLINEACLKIQNGEVDSVMILGGEARYKILRSIIENRSYEEKVLLDNPDFYVKAKEDLYGDEELRELGNMAVGYYAIIESAIRKKKKESLQENIKNIGNIYEKFSKIAAKNPNGWIDKPFTKNEISTESDKNKMLAFPYNKLHCTSWNVNQAAALIICSEKLADELMIDKSKRVYPIASTENNHMLAIQQRPKLHESKGMKLAADKINEVIKNLELNIDAYDIYSCFPAAVKMSMESLSIDTNENLTVTGAMPYAGGPLNSYVIHSSVEMIRRIRDKDFHNGMVTGISGMMTKQSFCVWGNKFQKEFIFFDVTSAAQKHEKPCDFEETTEGKGTIIGYTIFENQDKELKAVLYLESENNKRKVVSSSENNFIKKLRTNEWVGREVFYRDSSILSWKN